MQLARAYLAEFDGKHGSIVDDPIAGKQGLNTLSLVAKQLAIAERADASATLDVELDDGASATFTLAELKAEALYIEAICRSCEKPRRAIAILEQAAALDPSHTGIPYFAGLLHMDLMHKRAAIAAFEQALALDPDNLEFRKMLVRAQSLSGAEVAYHKAAVGVRRGIATARVISLLVQLSPLIFLVIAMLTYLFATTPEGKASAFTPFLISVLLGLLFSAVRLAKHRVVSWFREHSV
jgi:tetratricopeptide (TPR) repeat protein